MVPKGDSSAISINLENPDCISVSVGKSKKVSITETGSKTKINIDTRYFDKVDSKPNVISLKLPDQEETNFGANDFYNYLLDTGMESLLFTVRVVLLFNVFRC